MRRIFSVEFCRFQRSRTQQRTPEVPRTASVPLSRWMREEKMIVDYECHVYVFPANCRYASLELYNALNGTHLPLHWNLIKIANMSSGFMSRFVAQTCPLWQWSLSNMPLVSLTRCSQEIEVVQHFGSFLSLHIDFIVPPVAIWQESVFQAILSNRGLDSKTLLIM